MTQIVSRLAALAKRRKVVNKKRWYVTIVKRDQAYGGRRKVVGGIRLKRSYPAHITNPFTSRMKREGIKIACGLKQSRSGTKGATPSTPFCLRASMTYVSRKVQPKICRK